MNFDFSDEQKLLREQARKFLGGRCPPRRVRAVLESDAGYDRDLWKSIAGMGWLGTAIPESWGGLGLGALELCVIAEELGRVLAPVPFSSTVSLFAEALLLSGSEQQKQRYLPRLAQGECIGTLARTEHAGAVTPKSIRTWLRAGRISGTKIAVPDGMDADAALVLVRTGEEVGERGLSLVVVDLDAEGITRKRQESIDPSRKRAVLTFDEAPAELLGEVGEGWDLQRRIMDRAAVLTAFEQVGGADACLNMAKGYALTRYAFGRPIGSFQAIRHKLADMYIATELARSNAYYGAWALSTNARELPLAAAAARISATQAFDFAADENVQVHGGIGFTWEADCHLFQKRARDLALALGPQRVWKDRLVTELELSNVA
ncbi:MAG TPA: acyl-CoA dehydrogenase family protein [Rhizomicrobium sp.]|jgi:acyl-CoA dehydrogenase|nr:acyl-CoA dehydrogenase family protein [Rhizomicrobium sp.]